MQPGDCSPQRTAGMFFLSRANAAWGAVQSREAAAIANSKRTSLRRQRRRMAYGFGGAVTDNVTVGAEVVVPVPVLLEITPLESMPTIVNV